MKEWHKHTLPCSVWSPDSCVSALPSQAQEMPGATEKQSCPTEGFSTWHPESQSYSESPGQQQLALAGVVIWRHRGAWASARTRGHGRRGPRRQSTVSSRTHTWHMPLPLPGMPSLYLQFSAPPGTFARHSHSLHSALPHRKAHSMYVSQLVRDDRASCFFPSSTIHGLSDFTSLSFLFPLKW